MRPVLRAHTPRPSDAFTGAALFSLGALLLFSPPVHAAAQLPTGFTDSTVVTGLDFPVGMAFLPDGRLLVVEQKSAKLRLIVKGALATTDPVCKVDDVVITGTEQGLLGIAVDPGWPARPYLYIHCDSGTPSHTIRISRYTAAGTLSWTGSGANALTVDLATRRDLLTNLPDAAVNHNGGTLRFGPDGMLYASVGEDAQAWMAQDDSTMHGVILRLDVTRLPSTPGGPPTRDIITPPDNPQVGSNNTLRRLIWAWGLRNPFRFSIDPTNGDVFIGDVGEGSFEEVDRVPAGGLADLGWPLFEGPKIHDLSVDSTARLVPPIAWYDRSAFATGASVVCAGAYRVPAGAGRPFAATYSGDVFYSDYFAGFLRRAHFNGTNWVTAAAVAGQPSSTDWARGMDGVADYLVAPNGSFWFLRQHVNSAAGSGSVHSIVAPIIVAGVGDGPGARVPRVALDRPYPQPARGQVELRYSASGAGPVELGIFDLNGRRVRVLLHDPSVSAGVWTTATWDGADETGRRVAPGVYMARLESGGEATSRRIMLLR